jgi:hypothetical protein
MEAEEPAPPSADVATQTEHPEPAPLRAEVGTQTMIEEPIPMLIPGPPPGEPPMPDPPGPPEEWFEGLSRRHDVFPSLS